MPATPPTIVLNVGVALGDFGRVSRVIDDWQREGADYNWRETMQASMDKQIEIRSFFATETLAENYIIFMYNAQARAILLRNNMDGRQYSVVLKKVMHVHEGAPQKIGGAGLVTGEWRVRATLLIRRL
jgi:hypothetical protein